MFTEDFIVAPDIAFNRVVAHMLSAPADDPLYFYANSARVELKRSNSVGSSRENK